MEMVGLALVVVGAIVAVVGSIWFLVVACSESILWGLGCFFVPFVSLIFLVMHWNKAAKPFLLNLGGIVLIVLGSILGGSLQR